MNNSTPVVFIILGIVVLAALFLGNSDPIPAATGEAEASALLAKVPAGGWIAGKAIGGLFSFVLSGIALSVVGFVVSELRKWWRNRQYQPNKWKSGSFAYWQKNTPSAQPKPKSLSLDQKVELALYRKAHLFQTKDTNQRPSPPPMVVQQSQSNDGFELRF